MIFVNRYLLTNKGKLLTKHSISLLWLVIETHGPKLSNIAISFYLNIVQKKSRVIWALLTILQVTDD